MSHSRYDVTNIWWLSRVSAVLRRSQPVSGGQPDEAKDDEGTPQGILDLRYQLVVRSGALTRHLSHHTQAAAILKES